MSNLALKAVAGLGLAAREQWRDWQHYAALLGALLWASLQPRNWRRTVRGVFARQVLFSGVESVRFILVVAVLAGLTVVVQAQVWTQRVGQSRLLGPLLVAVVARELAPLFANFVLIVRSGGAIATELGLMKAGGEVRALEAQGLDPLLFLVMPRVLGLVLAAFGLTAFFIPVAFASGYGFGALLGLSSVDPVVFLQGVFKAVRPVDALSIALKSLLPAAITGVICATEGLSVAQAATELPVATKRALARSLGALFLLSVFISLLAYL